MLSKPQTKSCKKCGYIQESNAVLLPECPRCGAIYAKVDAIAATGVQVKKSYALNQSISAAHTSKAAKPRRPIWTELLIALAIIAVLLLHLVAIAAFAIVIFPPAGDGGYQSANNWKHGYSTIMTGLALGISVVSVGCIGAALARNTLKGLLFSLPVGILTAIVYWFLAF